MIQTMDNRLIMDASNIYWGKIENIASAVRLACQETGCDPKKFNPAINVRGYKCEILLGNRDFIKK